MEAFRSTYDVTAIDMRGYGMSSKPDSIQAYAIGNLAADIAAVIKTLGNGRKAILIAHDWGGAVCWTVGHKYPELLSHLIIACAPHPLCTKANMDLNQFLRSYYIFLFQLPFIPEIAITGGDYALVDEAFLNGPMAVRRRGAMTAEDAKRYKKELARPGAVTATVNYYRALGRRMAYGGDKTSDGSLRKPISVPTLLIWAENDGALGPQLMRGTEKYVSNLRVRVLGNCSHWAQQDCPEEFNKMVMDFLARD